MNAGSTLYTHKHFSHYPYTHTRVDKANYDNGCPSLIPMQVSHFIMYIQIITACTVELEV